MITYQHSFGFISIDTWGKPFLILTEDRYDGEQHTWYNYYKLEVYFNTDDEAKAEVEKLNQESLLPKTFDSENSQNFLIDIQEKYSKSSIIKK